MTDSDAQTFTWPDGGQTPFAGATVMALEGGLRVPAVLRCSGKAPVATVENGIISGMDLFRAFLTAAGDSLTAANAATYPLAARSKSRSVR